MRSIYSFLFLVLFLYLPELKRAHAQVQSDSIQTERLASLSELWGAVKYFHPALVNHDINWDSALVSIAPDVIAATDSSTYAQAIQEMLSVLNDPVTQLIQSDISRESSKMEARPFISWSGDSVLVVSLNAETVIFEDDFQTIRQLRELQNHLPQAKGIVLDLRSISSSQLLDYVFEDSGLDAALTAVPLDIPGQRMRMHMGYANQLGASEYYSAFYTKDGRRLMPNGNGVEMPIVFLVNPDGELPSIALGLQQAGRAAIVSEGQFSDELFVATHTVTMSDGVQAQVRLGELVYTDGTSEFAPNVNIAIQESEEVGDRALARSLSLIEKFNLSPVPRPKLSFAANWIPDTIYDDDLYPSVGYRVLAAARIWSVINYFFPYHDLMDEEWGQVFRKHLPDVVHAQDTLAYHLALKKLYAEIKDTHGNLRSRVLGEYFGAASSAVYARWIENQPVIVDIFDDRAAKEAGVEIGDIILDVDGEKATDRIERIAAYMAASTPQALKKRATDVMLLGPNETDIALTLMDKEGKTKSVKLPRKVDYFDLWGTSRSGDVVKRLQDNIGYVDLDRLTVEEVSSMFDQLKNTEAIIFDMRGYPNSTAWTIAPYLAMKPKTGAMLADVPMILSPNESGYQKYTSIDYLPPTPSHIDKYDGKTVMLIDERAVSQAEMTGMFFEVANGTVFIGSHSNGANGDVTRFTVPGGITLSFSGQSIRHADGRQLQRVGLVPHLEVKPTIKGIREGRDEILEAAIEYLNKELRSESTDK